MRVLLHCRAQQGGEGWARQWGLWRARGWWMTVFRVERGRTQAQLPLTAELFKMNRSEYFRVGVGEFDLGKWVYMCATRGDE